MQAEEGDHCRMTREEIKDKIATYAGGRTAEEIAVGSISIGASNGEAYAPFMLHIQPAFG